MKLYLVRHGESDGNANRIHQDAQVPLSPRGLQEARVLAERLCDVPIDTIISSPFQRALQTATVIGEVLNRPVQTCALFVEVKRPTEIEGRPMEDPRVVAIKNRILDNWHDRDWRHSDEETFFDLRSRAIEALEFIAGRESPHMLIVTHGQFMRLLVSVMAFGQTLEADVFRQLQTFLTMSNSALTRCELRRGQWQLITWNDRSHLT
jgi:phosphoserine phosphatase